MVCGSPVVASADLFRQLAGECDHIVAVDRGLDALLGAGLCCDVYVGDADTVSDAGRALVDAAADFEVERHNPYKDYTDLALALDSVRRRWPGAEVVATCATGGRPDMALSVLGLLAGYADAPVWIEEDEVTARILHQDDLDYRKLRGQNLLHHRHRSQHGDKRTRPRVGARLFPPRLVSRHGHL